MKKIPWFSLALLLVTYSTVGWVLYAISGNSQCYIPVASVEYSCRWLVFLLTVSLILLAAEVFAYPFSNIRKALIYSIGTDTRAFILAIFLAFLAVVLAMWIHLIVHALVLFCAGLLARLDMLKYGFKDWQTFWILTLVSLAGFGIGWGGHHLAIAP